MLKSIVIENYRGYDKHELDFKDLSVIVGKNNAGKSTLLEALRLISLITNKYENQTFHNIPEWLPNFPIVYKGISPSVKGIDLLFENIYNNYNEPPAKIIAYFSNNAKIELYIGGNNEIFAILFDSNNKVITTKGQSKLLNLPKLNILPQIMPLQRTEKLLSEDYVRANISSTLSSLHFRNQLSYLHKEYYAIFKNLVENTWQGIFIKDFEKGDKLLDTHHSLFIRENHFVTEVGWVGHGLQMWLQIIWFLARCDKDTTIILDEPDVYLHADLQRRLIRFIKDSYKQVIIATHSIEIISEVSPENILIVNKEKPKSIYAGNLLNVQGLIEQIGSIHNIEIIRTIASKKFIIFEGEKDDLKYLNTFYSILFPNSDYPLDTIPHTYLEGWQGWQRVVGIQKAIKSTSSLSIYCLFDRDYHTEQEISERYKKAEEICVNVHIWKQKEIENYLILPQVIARVIAKNKNVEDLTESVIKDKINSIVEIQKDYVIDSYATSIQNFDKKKVVSTANQEARQFVNSKWSTHKISLVSGKYILTQLFDLLKKEHNISMSINSILQEIQKDDIPTEIIKVLNAIENNQKFSL